MVKIVRTTISLTFHSRKTSKRYQKYKKQKTKLKRRPESRLLTSFSYCLQKCFQSNSKFLSMPVIGHSIMASSYLDQSDSSLKDALSGVWWGATVLFEASSVWHVSATDLFVYLVKYRPITEYVHIPNNVEWCRLVLAGKEDEFFDFVEFLDILDGFLHDFRLLL